MHTAVAAEVLHIVVAAAVLHIVVVVEDMVTEDMGTELEGNPIAALEGGQGTPLYSHIHFACMWYIFLMAPSFIVTSCTAAPNHEYRHLLYNSIHESISYF